MESRDRAVARIRRIWRRRRRVRDSRFRGRCGCGRRELAETVGSDGVGERGEWRRSPRAKLILATLPACGCCGCGWRRSDRVARDRQIEEGALGVDAGDDGFDGDFFAVGENDAGDCVVFDADVLDFGMGADFGAGGACGFGEGVSKSAESAVRERLRSRRDVDRRRREGGERQWCLRTKGRERSRRFRGRRWWRGEVRFRKIRRRNRRRPSGPSAED